MARRRLRNSGLIDHPFVRPEEVVRWHGAMQSQEYGLAKWSIGERLAQEVDDDVERSISTGAILRTHVLRPTWHFVSAEDIRWLVELTGPRVQRQVEPRYRNLGLDVRTRGRAESVITTSLEGGNHLTRAELGDLLRRRRIDVTGQRLPHLIMHCELEAMICSGQPVGKQQTYALLDERVPTKTGATPKNGVQELCRRYLQSHGPATVADLRWWSSLTMAEIREGLDRLGSEVRTERVGGLTLWSLAEARAPRWRRRGHLLQAYDEVIVGYTESRFFGDQRAASVRAAWRDRSVPSGVIMLDDRVAGHWRRAMTKGMVTVDALLYGKPAESERRLLEAAAGRFGKFFGQEARLTGRLADADEFA
ncbi:MAG TPA: winged helix DNA-binding domain-containing protein [Actinomycetota bacterium]